MGQGPPEEQLKQLLAGLGIFLVVYFIYLVVLLATLIYYLITMSSALRQVSPDNRAMEPGLVFLGLIPCFMMVWSFVIAGRVSRSLEKEYQQRGLEGDGDFGWSIGLFASVFLIVTPLWIILGLLHARKVRRYLRMLEVARPPAELPQPTGYEEED